MTDERSHDDYIRQGLQDYEHSYMDWEMEMVIDHIVILSELKNKILILILEMKRGLIESYEEKKK